MKKAWTLFFSFFMAFCLSAFSQTNGYLFIIGGGSLPESMMKNFVEIAAKYKSGKIIVFPMASAEPDKVGPEQADELRKYGARDVECHILSWEQAMLEESTKIFDDAGGVFFCGGVQSRLTQRTNHLNLVYEDRLNGVITVEQYKEKRDEIQNEIYHIEEQIKGLGNENVGFKDQGVMILDLIKGVRDTYRKQDLKGKSEILNIVLDKCLLNDEPFFQWKEPFRTLFEINEILKQEQKGVIQLKQWGE